MYSPSKKRTAQLLLCSLLLESCYNPNLGISKKTLPAPPAPTYQQHQYEQEPHDKPPSLTATTADDPPIQFTYHHGQRQAAVRSQPQPRATTQPLPRPGREAPRQQNELAQTTHPPSLTHQTPPDIANQAFQAQGRQRVRFRHQEGQWQARVTERIGAFSRIAVLPIVFERHGDIAAALRALQGKPAQYVQRRIHVLPQKGPHPAMVFIGAQGLPGDMDRAGQPSGSGEPQDELLMRRHVGASEREQGQELAALLDRSASMALQERMAQEDITSTEALVEVLNAAQTPEQQQELQEWVRAYITWFNEQAWPFMSIASWHTSDQITPRRSYS